MIIETLTILYYSIATLSIGLVLCQTYNTQITQCINKWIYNYELVNTDDNDDNVDNNYTNKENDLGLRQQLNNPEDNYILFNEMDEINEINNNQINNNQINNQNIKTKKNVIIDFE